ncbi:hypothetical protein ACLB2K_028143 [Fragaria x ananassa]
MCVHYRLLLNSSDLTQVTHFFLSSFVALNAFEFVLTDRDLIQIAAKSNGVKDCESSNCDESPDLKMQQQPDDGVEVKAPPPPTNIHR